MQSVKGIASKPPRKTAQRPELPTQKASSIAQDAYHPHGTNKLDVSGIWVACAAGTKVAPLRAPIPTAVKSVIVKGIQHASWDNTIK
jgi:hypothetical protein